MPAFKNLSIFAKLAVVFSLITLITICTVFISLINGKRLIAASSEIIRTHREIAHLETIYLLIVEAETGQRGFLLTGDPAYLEPYNRAIAQISAQLTATRSESSDERIFKLVDELEYVASLKTDELHETIQLYKEGDVEQSIDLVKSGKGQLLMAKIRSLISQMTNIEDELLTERSMKPRASEINNYKVALAMLSGGILFELLLALLIYRSIVLPINDMRKGIDAIVKGECDYTFSIDQKDEMGLLAEAFNSLIRRLQNQTHQVERERNQLLSILNSIDAVIYIADIQTHRLLFVNEFVQKSFKGDLTGGLCYQKLQNLDAPCPFCTNELLMADKEKLHKWEYHNPVINRDYLITDKLIRWKDDKLVRFEIAFDVTKIKEYQRRLLASNAELEQFAYIASHDLQEPLRMVSSFLQLLEEDYRDVIDEEGLEYIHYAVDGAHRMKQLIDDLLTYSRVQKKSAKMDTLQLNEVIHEACQNLAMQRAEKAAEIEIDVQGAVKGDRTQLVQLFQNLISNGLKYNESATPKIVISSDTANASTLTVRVKDNGIGVKTEYFNKIFDIFCRLHAKNEYSGTGIGLAVCKKITDHHGARIWIESEFGKGSTFAVEFKTQG